MPLTLSIRVTRAAPNSRCPPPLLFVLVLAFVRKRIDPLCPRLQAPQPLPHRPRSYTLIVGFEIGSELSLQLLGPDLDSTLSQQAFSGKKRHP